MANPKRSERLFKIFGKVVFVVFFSLVQTSFVTALPWPWDFFNLVLSVAIFITVILSYRQGLWFAVFSGLIIDLFSFLNFGTMVCVMLLTVISVNGLFNNFFTNRSFYSLIILGFLGSVIYFILLFVFNLAFFISGAANNLDKFFTAANLYGSLWQAVFNVFLLAVLFIVFNFVSKKLKSVFY